MLDKESIMSQVQQLAEEARETGPVGEALKVASGIDAEPGRPPIYMGKDHEVIPSKYVIYYSLVQCKNCGHATRESEFFALSHIRSRITGARVRHLTKCPAPLYNVPVEKTLTGCHTIPYCQACDAVDLSHLPPPPQESQLYDLEEPRLKGQKPRDPAAKKPTTEAKKPHKATLDDLA